MSHFYNTPANALQDDDERRRRHSVLMQAMGAALPAPVDPLLQYIFFAPLTHSLVPTSAGNPTFTFSRVTTAAYVSDFEGVLRQAIANEARFTGARRVRNCIGTTSENFSNAAWVKGTMTPTAGVADPLGGTSATTLTATGANAFCFQNPLSGFTSTSTIVNSAWIRRRTGTGQIIFRNPNNTDVDITSQLTTSWKRFSTTSVPHVSLAAYLFFGITVSGDAIDVAWPQVEDVSGQSNQAPGEYVSVGVLAAPYHGVGNTVDGIKCFLTTNNNSVAANVVTQAPGTPIPLATTLGLVCENAATNICLRSQEFDNAAWTQNNATIAANAMAAPDGTLTADTLTDNATSGPHRVYQTGTFVAAAATVYTYSVYLKAGTLTWAQLYAAINLDKWANFNLQTGVVGNVAANTTASITALPNGWYRCAITFTTELTGSNVQVCALNANTAAPTPSYVGTGQTMYLWGAQVETGTDCSTYIPTTTVAVVRNADSDPYAMVSNLDGATGTVYAETYLPSAFAGVAQTIVGLAGGVNPQEYEIAKTLGNLSAAGTVASANTRTLGAVNKSAVAWSGATVSVCLNGGAVATGAFTAYANSGNVTVGNNSAGTLALRGSIRNVKFYATRLTDVELQALTA